jgi:GH24 family phage-related lysozyme (muramidase)
MARDTSKDITHENMRARLSQKSQQTASSLKSAVSPKSSPEDLNLDSAEEILGAIYELMVKNREQMVKTRELEQRLDKEKKKQDDTQHNEILKALTVRRKPGRKKKPEEAKKEEPKKPAEKAPETKGTDKAAQEAKDKAAKEAKDKAAEKAKQDAVDKAKKTAEKEGEKAKQTAEKESKVARDKVEKEVEAAKKKAEPVKEKPAKAPKKAEPAPKAPETTTPTKQSAIKEVIPNAQKLVMAGSLLAMASSVIAKEEGLPKKGKAYWDPPNQKKLVSIGYGHQIKDFEYTQGYISAGDEKVPLKGDRGIDTVMTAEQSKKLLEIDAPKYEKAAKTPLGDSWEKLSEQQKSALISYAYNVGSTNSLVKNGLKDAIDSGNMKLAAQIIREKGIRTANGVFNETLDKRRRKEADLFESGIQINPVVNVPSSNTTGIKIDQSSQENKDLKDQMVKNKITNTVNNQSTNVQQGSQTPVPQQKVDDRPPILRK